MLVRDADPQRDASACAAIYGPYVSDSVVSFEERPPTLEETAERMRSAYAWVLAEHEGLTLGYAYGSRHRERAAYRWAADVTVYIDSGHHRSGSSRNKSPKATASTSDRGGQANASAMRAS